MAHYQMVFDTREGEKRYPVEIAETDVLDTALREALVDLRRRGHLMPGAATGHLKVIAGGRELDLSKSLPAQGIYPNEVLRVLMEAYVAG